MTVKITNLSKVEVSFLMSSKNDAMFDTVLVKPGKSIKIEMRYGGVAKPPSRIVKDADPFKRDEADLHLQVQVQPATKDKECE